MFNYGVEKLCYKKNRKIIAMEIDFVTPQQNHKIHDYCFFCFILQRKAYLYYPLTNIKPKPCMK